MLESIVIGLIGITAVVLYMFIGIVLTATLNCIEDAPVENLSHEVVIWPLVLVVAILFLIATATSYAYGYLFKKTIPQYINDCVRYFYDKCQKVKDRMRED